METIKSVANRRIKERASLHLKKNRDASHLFLVEGAHMVEAARQAGVLKEVYALPKDHIKNAIPCTEVVLSKLSGLTSSGAPVGVCEKPVFPDVRFERVLILERVQDPGNVGTLIRSACAFGVDAVLLSEGCADPYAFKSLQSTQGAIFEIPVFQENPVAWLKKHPEVTSYAACLRRDSQPLRAVEAPQSWALCIGNEGQGLSEELIEACDHRVEIEMKRFESLNAAVAGSICLWYFSS